jgi:hypothetical protein
LTKKPVLGLLALLVGFQTQPLGHTAYKVLDLSAGDAYPWVAFFTGVVGLVLVWTGLKKAELPATVFGLLGGWLLWIGWFEFAYKFFGDLYAVPPYNVEPDYPGGYAAAPQASMQQATVTIMLGLFIVYGLFNLQTKCNLMRWLHRNLGFSPGMPTPDNKRSFARITAMEVLFVTSFCYQFWLWAIYLGTKKPTAIGVIYLYAAWSLWAFYLVYNCTQQIRVAAAIRYGIGAGIVLWGVAEMPAHFGAYREYWLYPNEFPIFNLFSFSLFAGGLWILVRGRMSSAPTSSAAAS